MLFIWPVLMCGTLYSQGKSLPDVGVLAAGTKGRLREGNFNIRMRVLPDESLYFFIYSAYYIEYKISELFY